MHQNFAWIHDLLWRILEASVVFDRWLSPNHPHLNQDRSQHICLGSRAQHFMIDAHFLSSRFLNVNFSFSVCDLGFILDPVPSLSDHLGSVLNSYFYQLIILGLLSHPAITVLLTCWACFTPPQGLLYSSIFSTWSFLHSVFDSESLGGPSSTYNVHLGLYYSIAQSSTCNFATMELAALVP